jgi:predicted outer membrane repeat protein
MLITQRNNLLNKVAFVLGVWILTQLGPGYLSTAAASTCPENTSCVTRYDDEVASDGLNGLNLRQAVGETATSAVFIGATTAVTISLNTPLEIRKDISISAQVNSEGQNLVTIRPSDSFPFESESDEAPALIQIHAESATANVTISNLIVNGTSEDSETVRAIEVIANPIDTSTVPVLTIESSTIQNSHGDSNGGAVLTPGDITVSNSTFTENSADEYGGAIYASGQIYVENSTFTSNSAGDSGGAIATHSGETITVTNSAFQSNVATGISGDPYAGGGAIKGDNGLLQVDGSTFSENISNRDGGAILHFGDIEVTDSVFEENEAGFIAEDIVYSSFGNGGAIFAISEDEIDLVSVSIDSNSSFLGNKATGNGGAIDITGALVVTDTDFENNTAYLPFNEGGDGGDGGAINVEGRIEVNESSFTNNSAVEDGGAISVQGGIQVNQSSFTLNSALGDGGAIDIDTLSGFSGDESTSRISSSVFRSNEASNGDGGAINGSAYILNVEDSLFLDNYAEDDGGAIWSSGLVRVLDSDFNENTADIDGGAIYADSVQINQSQFLENEAAEDGGAIHVQNDESENILSAILNTEFNGNVSMSGQGNALYGNAWLLLNSFVNYRTRGGGSAIALETNFGSVSIGNSFVEQDPEGDDFCAIGFDYSANNFASDYSCLGVEADPVKSRVGSSSVDSDGYLAFSDDIFFGATGLLTMISSPALLANFVASEQQGLRSEFEPTVGIPTQDQIDAFESAEALKDNALEECQELYAGDAQDSCESAVWDWYDGLYDVVVSPFVVSPFTDQPGPYVNFYRLYSIPQDTKDVDGHEFIEQYLSVDQNYFDRAVLSTWTAGAVHQEPKPAVVSSSNRSISLIKSSGFSSLEEQKLRAEKAALAEAEKKAAKSLRLAAVEKRRALTAQMRAKMAQTQMRGEMLKLKKQWQNLMKNFK